jgi:hypothetical protein
MLPLKSPPLPTLQVTVLFSHLAPENATFASCAIASSISPLAFCATAAAPGLPCVLSNCAIEPMLLTLVVSFAAGFPAKPY